MEIKKILYFIIINFLLLISVPNIYSQVGANVVGNNSAVANSITLPTANLYYFVAASAGSTLTPSFNVMVNNGNYAVIGNSSTNSCSDTLYNGILQQYAVLGGDGYYSIWYRVYAYNSYGLYQYTNPQVIYIAQNAYNVSVVNNTLINTQIQRIINSAINNSIPVVVFSPGVYLVNLVIDPQGKNITLLRQNAIFEPANPGLPVIDIKSSNVTIQNININTNLFAINVNNGVLNTINSNINSGLFGINVKTHQ